jgi:hypothetical protein
MPILAVNETGEWKICPIEIECTIFPPITSLELLIKNFVYFVDEIFHVLILS